MEHLLIDFDRLSFKNSLIQTGTLLDRFACNLYFAMKIDKGPLDRFTLQFHQRVIH